MANKVWHVVEIRATYKQVLVEPAHARTWIGALPWPDRTPYSAKPAHFLGKRAAESVIRGFGFIEVGTLAQECDCAARPGRTLDECLADESGRNLAATSKG